jgi:hypothetical protein
MLFCYRPSNRRVSRCCVISLGFRHQPSNLPHVCPLLLRHKYPSNQLAENHTEHETFFQTLPRIDWSGTFFFVAGGVLVLLALNWGSTDS